MINYGKIDKIISFYEKNNFKNIEVPWLVTEEILIITRPEGTRLFKLEKHENNKCLVASAEQSFLYQYNKGFLSKGQFQATTPCFRFENFDDIHTKYFIKTELIKTDEVSIDNLIELVNLALTAFKEVIPLECHEYLSTQWTDNKSIDINLSGIELGSYGIRSCSFLTWIYGTGIAEPRLSKAIKKTNYKNGIS